MFLTVTIVGLLSGFSFTHVVPFVNGRRVRDPVTRIDVGGKLLTNHLKEIISYRQLHVLDETYVMNACREDCCYVSMDFEGDMKRAALRVSGLQTHVFLIQMLSFVRRETA